MKKKWILIVLLLAAIIGFWVWWKYLPLPFDAPREGTHMDAPK